ncbi:MAG TPA: hypothetical protein DCL54_07380 [Alphaproteobacteria bacterium]|nr:hypothetical protein [Alphaproteobacteria bacterium]
MAADPTNKSEPQKQDDKANEPLAQQPSDAAAISDTPSASKGANEKPKDETAQSSSAIADEAKAIPVDALPRKPETSGSDDEQLRIARQEYKDVGRRPLGGPTVGLPRLAKLNLQDLLSDRAPIPIPGLLPQTLIDPVLLLQALDLRLALGAIQAWGWDGTYMSLRTAQDASDSERLAMDQRRVSSILLDNLEAADSVSGRATTIFLDPCERGDLPAIWEGLSKDIDSVRAILAAQKTVLVLLVLGVKAASASEVLRGPGVQRIVLQSADQLRALCKSKKLEFYVPDGKLFEMAAENPTSLRDLYQALLEDEGDGMKLQVALDVVGPEKILKSRRDAGELVTRIVKEKLIDSAAALFVATHLPECAFADFSLMAEEIYKSSAPLSAQEEKGFSDSALAEAGLRRARISIDDRRPQNVARFSSGGVFGAAVRAQIQNTAAIFCDGAFKCLADNLTIGAVGENASYALANEAARH